MAHILLVEDDEQVRLLIEEILVMFGHRVAVAETVAAGCALLDASPSYDLTITDGRLPDGNGLTIANCATEHGIKVIIISGFLAAYPADQLLPYITLAKPFRVSQLTTAIAHVLTANG